MISRNSPAKQHYFMTGATGLLGRYLMKDLSLAGIPLVVLVRSNRRSTAQDRIESIMSYWDKQLGQVLPRPVVMEGDLSEPGLGLSDEQTEWVSQNCRGILHNAASLSFVSTGRDSEPYRSNVDGTRYVIDLSERCQMTEFHHVSTAYVCGLRNGVIQEQDLNEGQEFGNPYEESKAEAENMVHGADHLSSVTCYRPGIIVGDSQTGFTNTFHGFYAAVQLVNTLAEHGYDGETFDQESGHRCHTKVRLTVEGKDRKNFVPVDWVSAAMSHILSHQEHHGKTYHLTPDVPTDLRTINQAMCTATKIYGTRFVGSEVPISNPTEIESFFYQHFQVYNSYWRNDPKFDVSNTSKAAPHLPCPRMDYTSLVFLAKAAIEMGFSWRDEKVKTMNPASQEEMIAVT